MAWALLAQKRIFIHWNHMDKMFTLWKNILMFFEKVMLFYHQMTSIQDLLCYLSKQTDDYMTKYFKSPLCNLPFVYETSAF
ncbi:hypothetical protein T06_15322 [Trichinella sp. T6]|nr:hypothetical protein T06_15322 [Trichinella sp. T6]